MFEITNELGQIHFSKNIIDRICSDAVTAAGDARIQHYKGRYTTKKPGRLNAFHQNEVDEDGVVVEESQGAIRITIYIVIRFGVSMNQTADKIIDHVYREMEYLLGVKPANVTVIVTGTASKTIAKRRIEFSR